MAAQAKELTEHAVPYSDRDPSAPHSQTARESCAQDDNPCAGTLSEASGEGRTADGEPRPKKKLVRHSDRDYSQQLRLAFQLAFVALNVWIGVQFYLWVRWAESGGQTRAVARPAGVEGWLPIAGLMQLKYVLVTHRWPQIHPAGLFLFAAFLLISFLLRKTFCSWLCPVGSLSEYLWKLGRYIFRRNFPLPRWVDIPLRGSKYLLLAFFAYAVAMMPAQAIAAFLAEPYGLIVDVRMLNFFRFLGGTAAFVLLVLIVASLFVQNFWCRYLCPYGALMGLVSMLSPMRIRRNQSTCIDCAKCAKACPAQLPVDKLVQIRSAECIGCLECVAVCPAKDTLIFSLPSRRTVPAWSIAGAIAVLFVGLVGYAKITGHWDTHLPQQLFSNSCRRQAIRHIRNRSPSTLHHKAKLLSCFFYLDARLSAVTITGHLLVHARGEPVLDMLDTPLNGVLFICGTMILSVVGLLIVRRFADLEWLKRHHEVASFFFLMIGTLYAVLVAFAIFVVWTQFQDAGTNLEQEANAVADLSRMSLAMPEPLRSNIRSALLNYVNAVLQDEFPAMAEGRNSPRTWEAMQKLWTVYDDAEPNGIKGQVYFSESIKRLNDLSNYRRVRLFTSRGTVPTLLWYLLFIGGILLVGFTYLFGHESLLSQAAMTAAMTGVLAFSLFLIIAYDSPFGGSARVSETPFQVELEHVNLRH